MVYKGCAVVRALKLSLTVYGWKPLSQEQTRLVFAGSIAVRKLKVNLTVLI